jgi:hypothetical protein
VFFTLLSRVRAFASTVFGALRENGEVTQRQMYRFFP